MAFVLQDVHRRPRRKDPFDITLDPSLLVEGCPEVNTHLAQCLQQKGYCVLNCQISSERLGQVQAEVRDLDATGSFQAVPQVVQRGLLGVEASQRTCEVVAFEDLPALHELDSLVWSLAKAVGSNAEVPVEFHCNARTDCCVCKAAAEIEEEEAQLSTRELYKWWSLFTNSWIMTCVFLGPGDGYLDMRPYDEDANTVEIVAPPGSVVLLRTDLLQARYVPRDMSASILTSFFVSNRVMVPLDLNSAAAEMTPPARELHSRIVERIRDMKMEEEDGEDYSAVPRELVRAMNHHFYRRQQVAIRGMQSRTALSWEHSAELFAATTGVDLVTTVPLQRWNHETIYDPAAESWRYGATSCNHGSFMEGVELFDSKLFSVSNVEARGMDPHQRQVLEVGYESLYRAGLTKKTLMNIVCGVFIGIGSNEYNHKEAETDMGVHGATGGAPSICCGRFSFTHGLRGASVAIDLEAASGLTAAYWGADAVQQKGRGRVHDWSMSAGVRFLLAKKFWPGLSAAGLLTTVGRCMSFDASADGCVLADGVGALALQNFNGLVTYDDEGKVVESLTDAVDSDDRPFEGFIVGGAVSGAGRTSSLTLPSATGMQEVAAEAARLAGLQPADVDAVYVHGASTLMADAIEHVAMKRALRSQHPDEVLDVVSPKTQTGNSVEAAGLISAAMVINSLKRGSVCPINHLSQLNPYLDDLDCVELCTESLLYRSTNAFTGVQAHGMGGSNAHLLFFAGQG